MPIHWNQALVIEKLQPIEKWKSDAGRQLLTQLARGEIKREITFEQLGLPSWERSWLRRVLKWNFASKRPAKQNAWRIVRSLAEELDDLRNRQARRRTTLPRDQKRFRGNRMQLELLKRSLGSPREDNEWNDWRKKHRRIRPDLRGTNFRSTDLNDLHLDQASLQGADLSDCNLAGVHLSQANLRSAVLFQTNLTYADLSSSVFKGAWLHNVDLTYAKLKDSHLGGALLTSCNLNLANLEGADLRGAYIWGCSYWGIQLDDSTQQSGIKIGFGDFDWIELAIERRPGSAFPKPNFEVKIDDLRVADFMWQINDYPERVADMINAASGRLVLLLGRFRGKQKRVLHHSLSPALREMGYIPMVFNFNPPDSRDVIESVAILAGLSKFVIADLTNPRSTPLESQLVVPTLAVPFIPIIRKGESAFSMFSALQRKYPWVRPVVVYKTDAELVRRLKEEIVPSALRLAKQLQKNKSRPR